jgi:ion channel-forming bestrophin family protein
LVGAALGLLLVLRTNAGYDRWWEARKLWGGIVNQSRNLAIIGLTYGPVDETWRQNFVRMLAAFPHSARMTLRADKSCKALESLLGAQLSEEIVGTMHPPSTIACKLGTLLRQACESYGMDRFFFLQADRERAQLIDHIGACERILKTPLALAYSIKIRRFIALFVLTLPFALMHSFDNIVLVPLVTMLAAYPLFSLDQLGIELQNPFNVQHLSHLPLDEISATIEKNLLSLLQENSETSSMMIVSAGLDF